MVSLICNIADFTAEIIRDQNRKTEKKRFKRFQIITHSIAHDKPSELHSPFEEQSNSEFENDH
jgi:hypothetical protein